MKCKYDIDEIKRLLDAYYEGNTSIEQEKLLCDFFATATDIPAELEPDRELFVTLQAATETDIDIPSDLEQRLISHIDKLEAKGIHSRKKWIKPFAVISAAASIIILFVIALKFIPGEQFPYEQSGVTAMIEDLRRLMDKMEWWMLSKMMIMRSQLRKRQLNHRLLLPKKMTRSWLKKQ